MAKKKSKHMHSPAAAPKPWFDVFNGNVANPGEFIFIYALIGIMCIATLIFFAVSSSPKSEDDLQHANVTFVRYEKHEENLCLYTKGSEKYYSIPGYHETMTNLERFLSLCEDNSIFYVGYTDYPRADTPHFALESITDMEGSIYLTVDAVHAYRNHDAPAFYAIFGGMTIIWFMVVVISVYIGRHPENFSRRTIRLFFNDGYVRRCKTNKH